MLDWRHFIKRFLCGIHVNKQISYWFNTFSLMRAYVVWWWEKCVNQSAFTVRDTHCTYLLVFINNTSRVQWAKSWYALCCVYMHSTKSLQYLWPCRPLKCVTVMCIQKELRNQLEPHTRCSCNNKTSNNFRYLLSTGLHCFTVHFNSLNVMYHLLHWLYIIIY